MFVEMAQWYSATLPLEVRELVEAVERLTRSEGQPVDPKELEQFWARCEGLCRRRPATPGGSFRVR
jgi:hypothetical protein